MKTKNRIWMCPLIFVVSAFIFVTSNCKKDNGSGLQIGLKIGDSYQGGLIFYLDNTGNHGLVCTKFKLNTEFPYGAEWGCEEILIVGANSTALGTGNQNTIDIVNSCPNLGTAARICFDLEFQGYSDWFLPSYTELELICLNLHTVGLSNLNGDSYWSSNQYDANQAWYIHFLEGLPLDLIDEKSNSISVCAVRAF